MNMRFEVKPNGLVAFEGLVSCDDCAVGMANGDFSGMSDSVETAVKAGLSRLGKTGYAVLGNETGFSKFPCDCCLSRKHGNRHDFSLLALKAADR